LRELPRLMLVTSRERARARDIVEVVAAAAEGGVSFVQVREKELADEALAALVRRIRERVPPATVLVVNGRPAVARATGAGLHLPAADPWPEREGLTLVGRSIHGDAEAEIAVRDGADYVVAGPVHSTPSKPGHPGSGIDFLRAMVERVAPIPVFAIGGIRVSNVAEAIRAGARGVAVCGAIVEASDPRRATEALGLALEVGATTR
jgi:thiamine-phosphate pyrophosphorylase